MKSAPVHSQSFARTMLACASLALALSGCGGAGDLGGSSTAPAASIDAASPADNITAQPTSPNSPTAADVAFKDPITGELRAPTSEELEQLNRDKDASVDREQPSESAPQRIENPDGSSMTTGPTYADFQKVCRGADGKMIVGHDCEAAEQR
jgi:hypothetical protein